MAVDDDPAVRSMLEKLLSSFGLLPSSASSAREAIEALQEAPPDTPYELVVVDWQMPATNGLELCDLISQDNSLCPPPRLILVSGYWNRELAACVDEGRVAAFVLKPFTASTLFETILQVFADRFTSDPTPTEGEPAELAMPDLRGASILLAEDNELNQDVALGLLAETGCDVGLARDGTEAVEAIAQRAFDLVLMDIQMPEMDGYEATKRIRNAERRMRNGECEAEANGASDPEFPTPSSELRTPRSGIPIIAMTAGAMKEDREKALAAGMDDYIAKPVDPKELYRALARWIGPGEGHVREPDASPEAATQSKSWHAQLRDLDVIDIDTVLARFRGDAKRLRTFLAKIATNQASAAEDIRAALDSGDAEATQRLAHTLKGLAGTIGAEQLQTAAHDVEAALEDGGADAARSQLPALENRLQDVLDSLSRLAPEPGTPSADAEEAQQPASPEELAPLLSRLAALLEEHDPAALECVQALATTPTPRAISTVVRQLSELVGRYAFKEALARLKDLANSLDIDLTGSNSDGN